MTKQEKWNEIIQKIDELGEELHELVEDQIEVDDMLNFTLMELRTIVDELNNIKVGE